MKLLDIPLDDINLQDERFRFSYFFDLEKMLISIKKIGLVNPLMAVKREGSKYVIVCGWKRVLACRELSLAYVPVYLLDEQDDRRVFFLSLYENWAVRNFNILEKSEIIHKLNGFIGDEKKIVREFFPLLGIPVNLSYFDIYLRIAQLDPVWKKIIFKKKFPLSSIQLLTDFTREDRKLLLPFVLSLNVNKMKQFCEDLFELSKKTGDSPKILLSAPEILSVSQSENLSSLQKAERVRSLMRTKRYPTLSSWKKSFDTSLKKARLSKDVAFDSASFFEDGEFSVTFSLHDKEDFRKRLFKLQELVADEDLFSLFKSFSDG
ncbi:MAG: ParB N-terminal domain-containing protein [Candidatus Aminicenantes bacterium]|nr:MAG: ParB N-terminal domain-containing protein [Candidatus Aminicenantes bacterium]